MNIIDAIKSGKPLKRKCMSAWINRSFLFRAEDVLADDWEVEEIPEIIECEAQWLDIRRQPIRPEIIDKLQGKRWKVKFEEIK